MSKVIPGGWAGWKSGHTAWPRATMTLAPTGMPADDCSGVLVGGGGSRESESPKQCCPSAPAHRALGRVAQGHLLAKRDNGGLGGHLVKAEMILKK